MQTCRKWQTWRVCCSWFLHVKSKLGIKFAYLLFIIFVCSPWFGYLMNSHGVDSKYPDFTKTKLLYNPAYHISWCSKQHIHIHELNNSQPPLTSPVPRPDLGPIQFSWKFKTGVVICTKACKCCSIIVKEFFFCMSVCWL